MFCFIDHFGGVMHVCKVTHACFALLITSVVPHALMYILHVVSFSQVLAGGSFKSAGGVRASNIAKWDGNTWQRLADEVRPSSFG
jgi:hypothetical protein